MDASQIAATGSQVVTSIAAYVGIKELMPKLLGPTVEYLGTEAKSYTEQGLKNLKRIFTKAAARVPDLEQPGRVSPRVLKEILDEGYFCEDELAAEYFGGVLASSRSRVSRDDRGATFVKLVSSLSAYQLRLHHIYYATLRRRHLGTLANIQDVRPRETVFRTFISVKGLGDGFDLQPSENFETLLRHSVIGLNRQGLLWDDYAWGNPEHLNMINNFSTTEAGLIATPTLLGVELYLWAYGKGDVSLNKFFSPDLKLPLLPGVTYPS
ncbi:MAG TPA: hypothetical protein VGE76_01020 [Opitutaceae bacterium]